MVFVTISKKPRFPFLLFLELFAENRQKFNKNDGKTSILLVVTTLFNQTYHNQFITTSVIIQNHF